MSPQDLEKSILKFEDRCAQKAARWPRILLSASLTIAILLYYHFFYADWSHAYPTWTRFNILQDRFWLDLVVVSLSVLSLWVSNSLRNLFFMLTILSAWFFSCYKLNSLDLSSLVLPLYFAAMFLIFKFFPNRKYLKFSASIILFILTAHLIGILSLQKSDYRIFQFFWTLHPEYLLLHFCFWSFGSQTWVAVAPHNIATPVPLPLESSVASLPNEQKYTFSKGFYNLLFSVSTFAFTMKLLSIQMIFENPFLQSIYSYFIFLLCVVAGFNMTNALLRLHLVKVPDATFFVFLAKSPLELWSRGSVYIYRFFMQAIYLPVYRKTRSLALTLSFCFVAIFINLFFFHDIALRVLFRSILPTMPISSMDYVDFLVSSFIWLILWFLFSAIFYFIRKFLFRGKVWFDWTCILATHLLSSQVTFMAGFLNSHLKHF